MNAVPSWDEFIREHLLCKSLIGGVCLLSQHGEKVYTHGQLDSLSQDDVQQFVQAFKTRSPEAEQEIVQKGFSVSCLGQNRHFKIYSKTYSSIYSISLDSQLGMTVNKLPYGLLLCVFTNSLTAAKAVKQVEQFCDKLRI